MAICTNQCPDVPGNCEDEPINPPASPEDIANLSLWLKADSEVYDDLAGTVPSVDGSLVRFWKSQSVGLEDVLQNIDAIRPTFKTAIKNGLPVMRFNGTGEYLYSTSFVRNTPITFWITCKWDAAAAGILCPLLTFAPASKPLQRTAAGALKLFFITILQSADSVLAVETWYVITLRIDGNNSVLRVNGNTVASGNLTGTVAGQFIVGDSGTTNFDGDVGEIVMANNSSSLDEMIEIEQYLASLARWDITF